MTRLSRRRTHGRRHQHLLRPGPGLQRSLPHLRRQRPHQSAPAGIAGEQGRDGIEIPALGACHRQRPLRDTLERRRGRLKGMNRMGMHDVRHRFPERRLEA